MRVLAVVTIALDLDDLAAGDPQTEQAADVVRAIAQSARHRLVAHGVRVGEISAALHAPDPPPPEAP